MVILSPQAPGRVKNGGGDKAAEMAKDIIIPTRTKGAGRTSPARSTSTPSAAAILHLGVPGPVQSNEGFPEGKDLTTRKVNEYEGQHRFGGGTDSDCDPHVVDILAPNGKGGADEVRGPVRHVEVRVHPGRRPQVGRRPQDGQEIDPSNSIPEERN